VRGNQGECNRNASQNKVGKDSPKELRSDAGASNRGRSQNHDWKQWFHQNIGNFDIALFDENRWVKRIVTLNVTRRKQGNDMQDKQLENCCRFKGLGDWIFSAAATDVWTQHALEFVAFVNS